jgi:transcriptional regulator with XRE-family HTH domain
MNNNDEENHEQTLGDVIRDARTSKGHGLRTFAALAGITPSYQSDIENNRRIPAEEVVGKIAELLNLNFDTLMVLAGRFGEQAERYLKRQPEAIRLFRKISEANLTEEKLKELQRQVPPKENLK